MLPNHAPLVVAEQFALLEAAYPGPDRPRHRPGAGHRPGHRLGAAPRRRRRRATTRSRGSPSTSTTCSAMMAPDGVGLGGQRRTHALRATPQATSVPGVWLLGSSDYSARLAAEKGLPYVFAHHFSGRGTAEALELYRSTFQPSPELDREPADLPDRQRRRSPRPARRPTGSRCRSCWRWCALRTGQPLAPQLLRRGGREGRGCPPRTQPAARRDAGPLGDRHARRRRAREVRRARGDASTSTR